jgi:hypothetical protein
VRTKVPSAKYVQTWASSADKRGGATFAMNGTTVESRVTIACHSYRSSELNHSPFLSLRLMAAFLGLTLCAFSCLSAL